MRVMISCGEPSGDLYAGALAAELRARVPSIEIVGLGGPRLQAAGATLSGHFTGLTVTGLTEVVAVLPRSWRMYRRLVSDARARRPDVFVAIDFSGFNFRLMAALRRLGIPVVYYVSPQVWAWRSHRIQTMKRLVDKVLVIFPFEAPVYERAGVPVQFVGHPLVDLVRPEQPRTPFLSGLGLRPAARTVALLPGSRPNELQRIATTMAESAAIIRARVSGVQFVVARAPNLPDLLFAPFPPDVAIVEGKTDDVLAASDVVITASGTATVQAALHGRPMVVVYRVSPLTYRLGKPFVKLDTYAMVNLVAGRRIVPELIQMDFTAERVAHEAIALLTDADRHARTRDALRDVCQRLGTPGASGRAADAILEVAGRVPYGARSA
jgi:lipid-A-disaccharide synthase